MSNIVRLAPIRGLRPKLAPNKPEATGVAVTPDQQVCIQLVRHMPALVEHLDQIVEDLTRTLALLPGSLDKQAITMMIVEVKFSIKRVTTVLDSARAQMIAPREENYD